MKELPISNVEEAFVLAALAESRRMDGRAVYDVRDVGVVFGVDFGCAEVTLGDSRVLAQVSSSVNVPKENRPAEGLMKINVELSPMAAPEFEANRPNSDLHVEISRILERLIKESKCVDLEALCIISGEKVWDICVDVHILDHRGNLIDATSIAAMAALLHFRRPDVTVSGDEITIHSFDDKAPISLSVHHIPLCTTFAFMQQGSLMVVDPTDLEEKTMDGKIVIGMNVHQEICCLQMTGKLMLQKEQVIRCTNIALVKVHATTQTIKACLAEDSERRAKGLPVGFAAELRREKTKMKVEKDSLALDLKRARREADDMLVQWRKEGEENDEENGEDGESDDVDDDHKEEEDEEESSEKSETDSDDDVRDRVNNVAKDLGNVDVAAKRTTPNDGDLTKMTTNRANFGEGGPSQWDASDAEGVVVIDSGDSEEEDVIELTADDM